MAIRFALRRLGGASASAAIGARSSSAAASVASRDAALLVRLRSECAAAVADERFADDGLAAAVAGGGDDFAACVARVLAARLSRQNSDTRLPPAAVMALATAALAGDGRVGADVAARLDRTDAISALACVCYAPGFLACLAQRCAHAHWLAGGVENDHVAFALQDRANELWAVDAHPGAVLGGGLVMGTNTVVGETAVVGDGCVLEHGVTLGGTGRARAKRHPRLGAGVVVGAGATIIGPVTIGAGARVAPQAVVSVDVPPNFVARETNDLLDPADHDPATIAANPGSWWADVAIRAA